MMDRTKIGIKTAVIAVISSLIQGLLLLIRIKVILQIYGTELNGVMQVAVQMSAYLVLIESGMSAAYQYKIYSKIKDNDNYEVMRLYKGLSINMRSIAVKMILLFIVISFIYAGIVSKATINYIDIVLIFIVMGARFAAPYFFTLPQRALIATFERKYIADAIQNIVDIFVVIIEIILVYTIKPPLFVVLIVALIGTLITVPILNRFIRIRFGMSLQNNSVPNMEPKRMTKDILVHQLSGLVFSNTDNVLLSIFKTLNSVTIYSAFNTLISYPTQLINRIIDGLRASLAMKIEGKDKNSFSVYNEMLSITSFCAGIIAPVFIIMANPFVGLWIGDQYTISQIDIYLFSLIIIHRTLMPVVYAARDARGLYKESKKYTILQAVVNLLLSLVLIIPLGITGVLIGTVVSTYFILQPFNFIIVYKKVFKKNFLLVYKQIVGIAAHTYLVVWVCELLMKWLPSNNAYGWVDFIYEILLSFSITSIIGVVSYLMFSPSIRLFRKRMLRAFTQIKAKKFD